VAYKLCSNHSTIRIGFEKPATYRIRFQGELADSLVDRLGGMTVSTKRSENTPAVTTLEGYVADQAALLGLLNTLYDYHLLLFVECLDEKRFDSNESDNIRK
jgi:hypothetical protein